MRIRSANISSLRGGASLPTWPISATWILGGIIFGFGLMFASTLYVGALGNAGRIAVLVTGFSIMSVASLPLVSRVNKSFIQDAGKPLLVVIACLVIMGLRKHEFGGAGGSAFILIAVSFFFVAFGVGKLMRAQAPELPRNLTALLVVFLVGAIFWYELVQAQSVFLTGRVEGDEALHPVGVAYVTGVCIVMAATIGLFSSGSIRPIIAAVSLPILLLDFFGAASRGAAMALVVTGVFLVLTTMLTRMRGENRVRSKLKLIGIALVITIGLTFMAKSFLFGQSSFLLSRFQSLDNVYNDASASERIMIWQVYWSQLGDFWIFGLPAYAGPYPHNIFYEMWLRFGLVGWILIVSTLYAVVKLGRTLFSRALHPIDVLFGAMFVFGFVNGQFNLSLEFNRAFWLGLGYILAIDPVVKGRYKAFSIQSNWRKSPGQSIQSLPR